MANIRLIKRRIRVAANISQITKAMEMVAASKMKKAQEAALASKPYAEKISQVVSGLAGKVKIDVEEFPLFWQNLSSSKVLVVLISTNKGLCGGLNSNLFRYLKNWLPKAEEADFITLGKKGKLFILRTGRKLIADFSENPFLENVGAIINLVVSEYLKKEYREVWLVYNNFISILNQVPVRERILPIGALETRETDLTDILIEPDVKSLLNALLPYYLELKVRKAIQEAIASEHSARMMAMKAAYDNALELISALTLEYNKMRQQLITYEIADIVTAREAISNK